jgi:hypothetical protein
VTVLVWHAQASLALGLADAAADALSRAKALPAVGVVAARAKAALPQLERQLAELAARPPAAGVMALGDP